MNPVATPPLVVVMGVSGTGKSSVGQRLADEVGLTLIEGDEHHPPANIAKMSSGVPLTDADRRPWLESLASLLVSRHAQGVPTVLTCSALRRTYRDILRDGLPSDAVLFVHLHSSFDVLQERMTLRQRHFMPPSLLRSQLATLEPLEADEPGVVVDVAQPLDEVVSESVKAVRRCFG